MKKTITVIIVIIVSIIVQMMNFLPWWSFLVPVFLLGVFLPLEKWKVSPFLWGFLAGFLVWTLSTLYFELIYNGEIIKTVAKIIDVSSYLLYLITGCVGGVLTGLGLYSGFLLKKGREVLKLELQGN